jgi:hypothetical protein
MTTTTDRHPLTPAWGATLSPAAYTPGICAAWGARAIANAPAWDGRPVARGGKYRDRPADLPRIALDLLHDRQDCKAVDGFDRARLSAPLNAALDVIRARLAREGDVPVAPVSLSIDGVHVMLYASMNGGYVYLTALFATDFAAQYGVTPA